MLDMVERSVTAADWFDPTLDHFTDWLISDLKDLIQDDPRIPTKRRLELLDKVSSLASELSEARQEAAKRFN